MAFNYNDINMSMHGRLGQGQHVDIAYGNEGGRSLYVRSR